MMSITRLVVMTLGLSASLGVYGTGPLARTVTDDLGREVEVHDPPLRIVSLAPGATEMLFAAGAGGELIATVEYSDEPPAARRVPRIGDVVTVDMERLVALGPDVVIAWPAGGNPAQRARIGALHIPVYEQEVLRLAD
ncbi:MAG: cobalamin-binding protein, partial [Gammaproteobacteria bacterium]